MKIVKLILIGFIFILLSDISSAQNAFTSSADRSYMKIGSGADLADRIIYNGSSCFSTINWGIGVRLGDPSGITVKKYLPGNALEWSIGRTYVFSGREYYNDQFLDWYYDHNFEYTDFQYLGYQAYSPVGIQFHYLFRYPIDRIGEERVAGLEWYWGAGGQFRFQNYRYDYRYKPSGSNEWMYTTGRKVTDFDFGADGVIGLEYKFMDVPIAVFIDGTLFMEVVDDPFHFWLQGAVGARYLF